MAVLTAKELLGWLKTQVNSPSWTTGKLDKTKEQTICVYSGTSPQAATLNVAGSLGSYRNTSFKILVRWTTDFTQSVAKAAEVYSALPQSTHTIAGKIVHIVPKFDEAINLGTDEKGVYEHAIEITIISTER